VVFPSFYSPSSFRRQGGKGSPFPISPLYFFPPLNPLLGLRKKTPRTTNLLFSPFSRPLGYWGAVLAGNFFFSSCSFPFGTFKLSWVGGGLFGFWGIVSFSWFFAAFFRPSCSHKPFLHSKSFFPLFFSRTP